MFCTGSPLPAVSHLLRAPQVAASEAIKQWEVSTQQMCWTDGGMSGSRWRVRSARVGCSEERGQPTPVGFGRKKAFFFVNVQGQFSKRRYLQVEKDLH